MKKLLILVFITSFSLSFLPKPAFASVATWQKGVSIYPRSVDEFGSADMQATLSEIASDNANSVTLVIPYYQKNRFSNQMFSGRDTPSDTSLVAAIAWAHNDNLSVMLKIHVDSGDGVWRADISPGNRDLWFENYEKLLMHYVAIAKADKVEQICIGAELISVADANINIDNTKRWEKMISDIRQVYSGALTYSANWGPDSSSFADEKDHIGFWSDLDYIGISAYLPLAAKDDSVDSLAASFASWSMNDIVPLSQKFSKPILFTEIGYRSSANAYKIPYEFKGRGVYDEVEQANAYEAMFTFWDKVPEVSGISLWDFYANPKAGGTGDTDYTPQNKPAEAVLKKWFGQKPEIVQAAIITEPVAPPPIMPGFSYWGSFLHSILESRLLSGLI